MVSNISVPTYTIQHSGGKTSWQDGEIITANSLNKMQKQIKKNTDGFSNVVQYSNTQPTNEYNQVWIKENKEQNERTIRLAEMDDFDNFTNNVVVVSQEEPDNEVNKLWIHAGLDTEIQIPTYDEFTEVKNALITVLACFEHVAWVTPDGEDYYNAFAAAINPPSELVSISATYTQTKPVYVTDSLDILRQRLLVTATYANTSTQIINGYVLFGTLAEGTSTITVAYGGKTTTFTVVVSDTALLYKLPQPTTFDGTTSTVIDSGVALVPYDRDFTIVADFTPTNGSTRQHVFYAGDIASPYNSIVLECKKTTYVWGVTSYSASIEMPNMTANSPARIVIRHESGSGKYNIICAANGSLVRGETTMDRFISSRNIFVGGMRTTDSALGLIGTIRDFRVFIRYYSDADAMAYVSEVSQ